MGLVIAIHVSVCILLIIIILIQAGRGGGLVEGFSGVESMFGTKTNTFLTRTTTILSILFLTTCLSLAFLSARQSRSLMRSIKAPQQQPAQPGVPVKTEAPLETPKQETTKPEPLKQEITKEELPKPETPKSEVPKTQ